MQSSYKKENKLSHPSHLSHGNLYTWITTCCDGDGYGDRLLSILHICYSLFLHAWCGLFHLLEQFVPPSGTNYSYQWNNLFLYVKTGCTMR